MEVRLIIDDRARRIVLLKLTTDRHEPSHRPSATAGLLVSTLGVEYTVEKWWMSRDYIRRNVVEIRSKQASTQASLFAQSTNKDITSMNNVQGQAARKAHKVQHCWPPCKKNLTKKQTNKHIHVHRICAVHGSRLINWLSDETRCTATTADAYPISLSSAVVFYQLFHAVNESMKLYAASLRFTDNVATRWLVITIALYPLHP